MHKRLRFPLIGSAEGGSLPYISEWGVRVTPMAVR
jgi:hypothetical protein